MLRRGIAAVVLMSLAATTNASAGMPDVRRKADAANVTRLAEVIRDEVVAHPGAAAPMPKTPPYTHARVAALPAGPAARIAAYLGLLSADLGTDAAVRHVSALTSGPARSYLASLRRELTSPVALTVATEKFTHLPKSFAATLLFDATGHANIAALPLLLHAPPGFRGWWDIFDVVFAATVLVVCIAVEPCGAIGLALAEVGLLVATVELVGSYAEGQAGQIACDEGTYMYPYPDWHSGNDYAESWMQCGQSWSTTLQEVQVKMSDGSTPSDVEQFPSGTRYSFASVLITIPLLGCATAYGEGLWTHDGDPVGFGAYGYNSAGPYCYSKD